MRNHSPTQLLVRHARSQKFLKATGHWTRRVEAASNFPNLVNAVHTCMAHGIDEAQLVFRFEGETRDVCLPLR